MPVTINGGKYASASLSAVGTTTVTVTTTPFVSGDFSSTPRLVELRNSGGTVKGHAYVRRWVSTSQLELEEVFKDWKDGSTITQVVGDTVMVSLAPSEIVQAGIALSNNRLTITDTVTFAAGSVFLSEGYDWEFSGAYLVAFADLIVVAGTVVLGHLQDYATRQYYADNSWYCAVTALANGVNWVRASATTARFFAFGGSFRTSGLIWVEYGSGYNSNFTQRGTDWATIWSLGCDFRGVDVMSHMSGGPWTTGANHIVESCKMTSTASLSMLCRWANGTLIGGFYKFPLFTSNPLGVFGSDQTGTFTIAANPNTRGVVSDLGNNNAFWRSGNFQSGTRTINITNFLSSAYKCGFGNSVPETTNLTASTKNLYFQDSYQSCRNTTRAVTIRDATWTVEDAAVAASDGATLSPLVLYGSSIGIADVPYRGPFTARVRCYGYNELEFAVVRSTVSLGTAGSSVNIAYGGAQNQIPRTTLPAQATADGYTGVSIADHGTTPQSWQSLQWSITITGDLTTNPSLTAAQLWAHAKSQITKAATWGGKAGDLWHVVIDEGTSGAGYVTFRGLYGVTTLNATCTNSDATITVSSTSSMPTAGNFLLESEEISYTGKTATTLTGCTRGVNGTTAVSHTHDSTAPLPIKLYKGVRVVDQAGNAFPGVVSMRADNNTEYVPPVSATLVIAGAVTGSRYRVERVSDSSLVGEGTISGSANVNYTWTSDFAVLLIIRKSSSAPKYLEVVRTLTLTSSNQTINIEQQLDPVAQ